MIVILYRTWRSASEFVEGVSSDTLMIMESQPAMDGDFHVAYIESYDTASGCCIGEGKYFIKEDGNLPAEETTFEKIWKKYR